MKVYKIIIGKSGPCYTTEIGDVSEWIKNAGTWTRIIVDVLEMSKAEYTALPEYAGP